ncbi:YegP family protein, partial [Loigolactobacillus coryniformis]|uniref:YegP family protein n=1 Tax=Loigolactobacillus coryniformis TaxID=1610 RepID=UPI00201B0F8F
KKGEFRAQFAFRAEPIFWTENYKDRKGAKNAIEKIIKQAATAQVEEIDESVKAAKPAAKKAVAKVAAKKVEVKM